MSDANNIQPTRLQIGSSDRAVSPVALGTWPMTGVTSIDFNDGENILSTFKGIHEKTTLLENNHSTAEHILEIYDTLDTTDDH